MINNLIYNLELEFAKKFASGVVKGCLQFTSFRTVVCTFCKVRVPFKPGVNFIHKPDCLVEEAKNFLNHYGQ